MNTEKNYKEKIEDLISEWIKIDSEKKWNNWGKKINNLKFGTYGTISIFDVIKNTEIKFKNDWVKNSFINECKQALNNLNLK